MQVIKLILEHFKGIASGRGKDRVEIDFSKLSTNSRVIALSGPNGSSKTTIIDNMHPFRVMPSKSTTPTPTAFSFYPHIVAGQDAVKEIHWAHAGREFKSVLRLRTTPKKDKQECYLTEKIGQEFVPYQDSTGLTSDGKADTYDRAVVAVLGKPEVFFATQFSAQGKKPISTMQASEVKSLLASMLTMGSFKLLADKAGDVVKSLKPHLSAHQAQLLPLETKVLGLTEQVAWRNTLIETRAQNARTLASQKDVVKALCASVVELEGRIAQQQSVAAQAASLQMQLESVQTQNQTQLETFEQQQAVERQAMLKAHDNALSAVRVAELSKVAAAHRVADTQAIVLGEREILAARAARDSNQVKLNNLRVKQTDLYVDSTKFDQLTVLVATMRETYAAERSSGIFLKESIEAALAIAALIGEVPCKGHAFSSSCKLLADANAAALTLPAKQINIDSLRSKLTSDSVRLKTNVAELDRLVKVRDELTNLLVEIAALELEMTNAKAVLKNAPLVEKAKLEIDGLRAAAEVAKVDHAAALAVSVATAHQLSSIVEKQEVGLKSFLSVLYKEQLRIKGSIESLPPVVQANEITNVRARLDAAEQNVALTEQTREGLSDQLSRVVAEIAEAEQARAGINKTNLVCDAVSLEISQWTLLSKALGNDGIIAMSIDDAGPEISALCNSLLSECAGGRFTVSLSTQATTATGALKEVFVINVEDTIRGETKELGLMSGGEKVWINECLVRAMALYMAQSTGSNFKTLFSDEADGPLDPERKRQYMAMKRSVLERGGYDREFIITQTPELLLMVDDVIDVTKL